MNVDILKNKLNQYFNQSLKNFAKYPENYAFLITKGAILATSDSSSPQLIKILQDDANFRQNLETSLLKMPYPLKVKSYKIVPLTSTQFMIYPSLADGSTNEYTLKLFLINWYLHEDDTSKVIELIRSTDLTNKDKLELFGSSFDDRISKEVLKQGLSNDDIFRKYTRDGILNLGPYSYMIPLILENARDPREEQENILYIYNASEYPQEMRGILPDKLTIPSRGDHVLLSTLERLITRELEDEFIFLLKKYSEYIEDDDILELYRYTVEEKVSVPRIIAALASSKVVRNWYEVEDIFEIFGV